MSSKRAQKESGNTGGRKRQRSSEETAELCGAVEEAEVKGAVKEAWSNRTHYCKGDIELDCHPFPHCIIRNFLSSETFVENLKGELLELNFNEKSNDLYKFKQSDDLKKRKEPHIAAIRAALFGRFRSWLGDVLGVELEPTVDISCAKYEYTGEIYIGEKSCCIRLTVNHILSYFEMSFCATTTSWRGGASLSFCILCLHGRAATGAPSISTQQTVISGQRV